jgi:hypothetical protein
VPQRAVLIFSTICFKEFSQLPIVFSSHGIINFVVISGPLCEYKGKGKAVPLQVWGGSEGSRKLRFPDFLTTAQDGGKIISLTHRPHLPPGKTPGTHFC